MRAIQKLLPDPRHTEVHRIFVKASPELAWQTVRHYDAAHIPWIHLLFELRDLPNRLRGKVTIEKEFVLGVDQVAKSGDGFMIIHEEPGHEVVVGSVGQFWHADIPFAHITKEEFQNFNLPGWGKLAWSISVEPYLQGSTIALELRTTATDEESWEKLKKYYRFIGVGSRLIRESLLSHIEAELGKMKREFDDRPLDGDDIIPGAKYSITHHIDIEAPRSYVWRYLMQLGCDRAGWYSIDALDNGGTPSVDLLVEGWETRKVGDHLAATPNFDGYFEVFRTDFEKTFVLGGKTVRMGDPFRSTWAFIIEPIGNDATELIVRARMESSPRWKEWLLGSLLLPPVHSIMQGAQLRNLKKIIERDAHHRKNENVEAQLKLSLSK